MVKAVRGLWLVVSYSIRVSPWQALICLSESASVVLAVLQPLFLAWLVTGAIEGDTRRMALAVGAFIVSVAIGKLMALVGVNARVGQLERVGYAFGELIAEVTARLPTLDHLETPRYLDQMQTLRDQGWTLGLALNMVLNSVNNLILVGGTLILATTADPRLLLVAAAAVPGVLATRWFVRWQAEAEDQAAQPGRLTAHLLELGVEPVAGAELRVFGLAPVMRARLREATTRWRRPFVRMAARRAVAEAASSVLFFGVAAAVLGWMMYDVVAGVVPLKALVLGLMVVGRLQQAGGEAQASIGNISQAVRSASRVTWLLDYQQEVSRQHSGTAVPPAELRSGVRLEGLTFHYPEASQVALESLTLELPKASVVAFVGENGAGKTTLVKLLVGLFRPSSGRILVDGVDLSDLDIQLWRTRVSGAFQDYATFEVTAAQTVGLGDVGRIGDLGRIQTAVEAGAAEEVVAALPEGLDTQLGASWPDGVGLSGGQWQRLALARGMMRQAPLLLVLDEPTAALDARTEHTLFERYAAAARADLDRGTITLLITHRFSTAAAADHIVVLDHGRVLETGTHTELLAAGGRYAELYHLQARGYQ